MILQTFFNNELFPAALFFFSFCCYLENIIDYGFIIFYKQNKELISLCLHHSTQLVETDTKSKNKQRRCKVCTKNTCYKCGKCSKPGQPLVLCKEGLRDCFTRFHSERLYDLPSSISHQSCNSPEQIYHDIIRLSLWLHPLKMF